MLYRKYMKLRIFIIIVCIVGILSGYRSWNEVSDNNIALRKNGFRLALTSYPILSSAKRDVFFPELKGLNDESAVEWLISRYPNETDLKAFRDTRWPPMYELPKTLPLDNWSMEDLLYGIYFEDATKTAVPLDPAAQAKESKEEKDRIEHLAELIRTINISPVKDSIMHGVIGATLVSLLLAVLTTGFPFLWQICMRMLSDFSLAIRGKFAK